MPFEFFRTEIPEVVLIKPKVFGDDRGAFLEHWKESDFAAFGIKKPFKQVNHSVSTKNVLRGLHYQLADKAQAKLVYVIVGQIFDVGVDIRKGSPTYGKWVGRMLSAEDKNMLYIPEGFAHGFCVMSDTADVIYQCTGEYSQSHDRGILWSDNTINISWPVEEPVLSGKDKNLPFLEQAENDF